MGLAGVPWKQVGFDEWKGNKATGDTAIRGAVRQKVQEEREVMLRNNLSPKKSCSLLVWRDGPLLPAGFTFPELFVTAWAWVQGSEAGSEQGQGQC